jgi:hypothetical protein
LEAVKAFTNLLSKEAFITNARTNIMRISSRLIEISLRDVDVNVRINALKALAPTVNVSMGRATAAVEALRSSIEGLADWQELVDYLLLDHSTADSDMWLLAEEEEDFMIQVLIACIKASADEDVSISRRC